MSKPRKAEVPDLPPPRPWQNYRAHQVAAYTGLSERLIVRDCALGRIKHTRHGTAITIPGSEIMRLNGQAAA